ncbi:hypothetical protein DSUL_100139 [Desulfovibrionales bacterium]
MLNQLFVLAIKIIAETDISDLFLMNLDLALTVQTAPWLKAMLVEFSQKIFIGLFFLRLMLRS